MPNRRYCFLDFEVDSRSGEVRKLGVRLKIQEQPFKVLIQLLENAGELVPREDLRAALWPSETYVDFETGLNTAIKRLREMLGDSADHPAFIETLPRRGYRFVAPMKEDSVTAAGVLQPRTSEAAKRNRERLKLVVLPFANLSGNPEQEYFSDGMTEEMIAQLGRLNPNQLAVIARPSAMHYKGTAKRIDEIGRELGVDYILAGSVRRVGERVRITAQLAEASNQIQVWAESYDRRLSDILRLQADVAEAIAREIQIALAPMARESNKIQDQVAPEAYEAYLKGRYYWNKRTEQALRQASSYFQQAIEKCPDYAPAYAGLADSYILLGDTSYGVLRPCEAMQIAKNAAVRAVEIDESLAEAHTSLASVKEQFERDFKGAEKEYKRAIALQPGYAIAHHWYAYYLADVGRLAEAQAEIECARELDPLSLIINADLGWVYYLARNYDRAVEQLRKTLELDPDFVRAHYLLGRTYLEKGMYNQAVQELQKATDLSRGNAVYLAGLGCGYAKSGKTREAMRILDELVEMRSSQAYVPPYDIALVLVALGQQDSAFTWLEKAFEENSDFKDELKVGPMLDPLRSDPRFQELLRRVGLHA
jgi:TolB-like protein/Flp pilus assembly protein TadD